jgi:hypothetical protein
MGVKYLRLAVFSTACILASVSAQAQMATTIQLPNGGGTTGPITYCVAGTVVAGTCPIPVTVTGGSGSTVTANQGTPNAGGATNSWPVQGAGVAGTPAGGVVSIQGVSGGVAQPVSQATAANLNATIVGTGTFADQSTTSPGLRTLITLDVKTVTTGGTAVNAISAGHRTAGGFLQNPIGATIALCINEIGTATGTTSSGDTTCIQPGQSYTLSPASTAVSVITSDSSHPFSGYGLN